MPLLCFWMAICPFHLSHYLHSHPCHHQVKEKVPPPLPGSSGGHPPKLPTTNVWHATHILTSIKVDIDMEATKSFLLSLETPLYPIYQEIPQKEWVEGCGEAEEALA